MARKALEKVRGVRLPRWTMDEVRRIAKREKISEAQAIRLLLAVGVGVVGTTGTRLSGVIDAAPPSVAPLARIVPGGSPAATWDGASAGDDDPTDADESGWSSADWDSGIETMMGYNPDPEDDEE
jgi:hypothetical protein